MSGGAGAPADASDINFEDLQHQFEKRAQRNSLRIAAQQGDADIGLQKAEAAQRIKDTEDEAVLSMRKALRIGASGQRRDTCDQIRGGLVNMGFLLVLVGCEIDLIGFCLAFLEYWNLNILIIRVLLIAMPLGYLTAIVLYMCLTEDRDPAQEKDAKRDLEGGTGSSFAKRPRNPLNLRFFHFMPIFRYYLILKEKEAVDIEAVFRVNSLSSFTLGTCQICGILFLKFVKGAEMSIFVHINIFSQAVNWLITFVYYLTTISQQMGGYLQVETLNHNTDEDLRQKYREYLDIRQRAAEDEAEGGRKGLKRDLDKFVATIDNEIYFMSNLNSDSLPLSEVTMKSKLAALRALRRKDNLEFAKIGK